MNTTSNTTKNFGKTLVFFGNERLATGVTTDTPILKAFIEAGYKIGAIVSNYEYSQSRNARKLEIKQIAEQYDIPLLLPKSLGEVHEQLVGIGAEAAILVAYGRIVPQNIIDIFPKGIINLHPSLLPIHRGPTPIESAILNGDKKTGVSIMSLVKKMDAGPVYAQSEVELDGTESKQELADSLLEIGKSAIIDLLPDILRGNVVALPQDESRATYDTLITKEQGEINWNKSAEEIERQIRAYATWPKSYCSLKGKDVVITKARVVDTAGTPGTVSSADKSLVVACGSQSLVIEQLKPAGKEVIDAAAFINGYLKD